MLITPGEKRAHLPRGERFVLGMWSMGDLRRFTGEKLARMTRCWLDARPVTRSCAAQK
jgi:hypothetical protein